jgi:hypothetical protein
MNLFIEQLYQEWTVGQAGGQSGELGSDMGLINTGFIPIPRGEQPGFDHADAYRREAPAVSRLYVAHTGADRIEVIDCLTNNYLRSLPDLSGVAGVLIDNEQNFLFSSDRGCARVSIYRCSDETLLGRVGVGERPNGLAYDPLRRRLFVFNIGDPPGINCTVSVVAVDEMRVIATTSRCPVDRAGLFMTPSPGTSTPMFRSQLKSLCSVRRTSTSHRLSTSRLLGHTAW